ncbi:hypothetical protein CYMTET_29434 [Cymbomonas tetramitiformis]|uniref:Uncharacterized protein n=1 Tax=Cymbomonas tetramitiformis TaxID=36881 RepID=A0AAE0FL28_9CHLO|nr:hypothetical protein CYMTET_29434 [Cymbomonas tetramitiformis]
MADGSQARPPPASAAVEALSDPSDRGWLGSAGAALLDLLVLAPDGTLALYVGSFLICRCVLQHLPPALPAAAGGAETPGTPLSMDCSGGGEQPPGALSLELLSGTSPLSLPHPLQCALDRVQIGKPGTAAAAAEAQAATATREAWGDSTGNLEQPLGIEELHIIARPRCCVGGGVLEHHELYPTLHYPCL